MSLSAARAAWITSDARRDLRFGVEVAVRTALIAAGAPIEYAGELAGALVGQVDLIVAAPVQVDADEIDVVDHREAP